MYGSPTPDSFGTKIDIRTVVFEFVEKESRHGEESLTCMEQGCLESGGCGHGPRVPPGSCFSGFGEKLNRSCTASFSTTFRTYRIVPHLPYRSGRIRRPLFVGLTRPGGWYAKALPQCHYRDMERFSHRGSLPRRRKQIARWVGSGCQWSHIRSSFKKMRKTPRLWSVPCFPIIVPVRPHALPPALISLRPSCPRRVHFLLNIITTTTALHRKRKKDAIDAFSSSYSS